MVLPPSLKHLKLYENITLHLKKKNIENFSYFCLKIALIQESGEKIMHSKRINKQLYQYLPEKYKPFEPAVAQNNDSQWTKSLDKEMLQMHCG
jgi:hypothetical protein